MSATTKRRRRLRGSTFKWGAQQDEAHLDALSLRYGSFYKGLTNHWGYHLAVKLFSVEDQPEFKAIIFMFDLFQRNLYVCRVFIGNCEGLISEYIKGVIDSEDRSRRSSLQHLARNLATERDPQGRSQEPHQELLNLFGEISEDKDTFDVYEALGENLKIGCLSLVIGSRPRARVRRRRSILLIPHTTLAFSVNQTDLFSNPFSWRSLKSIPSKTQPHKKYPPLTTTPLFLGSSSFIFWKAVRRWTDTWIKSVNSSRVRSSFVSPHHIDYPTSGSISDGEADDAPGESTNIV